MKAKVQIKSVLEAISNEVFQMRDVNQAKEFIINYVSEKKIKDKELIIRNVEPLKNINAVHRYICNSLLAYEGMRVS